VKFETEMFGMFHVPSEKEVMLRAMAVEYLDRTEAFDRTICSGPVKQGFIMPATCREWSIISTHANSVLLELTQRASAIGFTRIDMLSAIQNHRLNVRTSA
jgi:hypothetical protein